MLLISQHDFVFLFGLTPEMGNSRKFNRIGGNTKCENLEIELEDLVLDV